jgi:hypothetical protein
MPPQQAPDVAPTAEKGPHHFNAKTDAQTVEYFVQDYLKSLQDMRSVHCIGYGCGWPTAMVDRIELMQILTPIWKDPNQRKELAVELQELGASKFSTAPNVKVIEKDGIVTGLEFTRSAWNYFAAADKVTLEEVTKNDSKHYLELRAIDSSSAAKPRNDFLVKDDRPLS